MEELKEGWRRDKLEKLTNYIARGVTPKYSENLDDMIVINQKCIRDGKLSLKDSRYHNYSLKKVTDDKILKKYDILVNSTGVGTLGRVCQNLLDNKNLTVDTHVTIVRPNSEKINPSYLGFAMRNIQTFIESLGEGSTGQTELKRQRLAEEVEIFYPENIKTQEKIASILSALDDKIEINNEINKTLEEMAQTLFKRWFIDFDFPNESGEPYKSSGGKMVDSELGEIPEGWRVGKINEIIEINPKENLKKGINSSYIDMKALSENQSVISGFINRNFTGSGTKFKNKDTLMARITPCLENGKTGFVNCLNNNIVAWGSTEFNVLRSRKNIPKELSYFIAKDEKFRKYAIRNMNGSSGRQRVNGTVLGEYRYPIANEFTIYQKFGFIVTEIMNKIENSRKEIQLLIVMRDTLLPKLINGEIEV